MKSVFLIEAMDCPVEENLIRDRLSKMKGIIGLNFDLLNRELTIDHNIGDESVFVSEIGKLGFEAIIKQGQVRGVNQTAKTAKSGWVLVFIALGFAALSETFEILKILDPYLSLVCALTAISLTGLKTYKKGWISLVNLNINIHALMGISVSGALCLQQWPEAAMVMVLFAIAEKIEALSLDRARNTLKKLVELTPSETRVIGADGSIRLSLSAEVEVGQVILIGPGERISHDGLVQRGDSSVDQSALSGESLPVDKTAGDEVFAGSLNQWGELVIEVGQKSENSLLSNIIRLVEQAQNKKAKSQRFVDTFARFYTPIVIIIALGLALIAPLAFGALWSNAIYQALVVLIIACPCALVISTPITLLSALTRAARSGVVIKGGVYLEQAAKLSWLAFDKTGTISLANPTLIETHLFSDKPDLLDLARSLASKSDHPVSRAIAQGQVLHNSHFEQFESLTGLGIKARVQNTTYFLGNLRLMKQYNITTGVCEKDYKKQTDRGRGTVFFADQGRVLALFALGDQIKPGAKGAFAQFQKLGLKTAVLSGDSQGPVDAMVKDLNVNEAIANLLPAQKATYVEDLQNKGNSVAMVGDGINDAPALAQARIGIAMGGLGTDIAVESADVIIMDDDLNKIALLIKLSKRTRSILVQNIAIALGIKVGFLILSFTGLGNMWMAVFADVGASLIVIANSLRLLRFKTKP